MAKVPKVVFLIKSLLFDMWFIFGSTFRNQMVLHAAIYFVNNFNPRKISYKLAFTAFIVFKLLSDKAFPSKNETPVAPFFFA